MDGFTILVVVGSALVFVVLHKRTKRQEAARELPHRDHLAPEERRKLGTTALVKWVYDGDTVDIECGRGKVCIRLYSIDSPENGQPWGDIATAGLIKMIGGQTVLLEEFGEDHYGRTLATIWVRDKKTHKWTNVNERMVMLGHAWIMRGHYAHHDPERQYKLEALERWARSKRVGLWNLPSPVPPWEWRRR